MPAPPTVLLYTYVEAGFAVPSNAELGCHSPEQPGTTRYNRPTSFTSKKKEDLPSPHDYCPTIHRRAALSLPRTRSRRPQSGLMKADFTDRLLGSTIFDLDSKLEWPRAQKFFAQILLMLTDQLPTQVLGHIERNGAEYLSEIETSRVRAILWTELGEDQMGNTPRGAALRAGLFAFGKTSNDGPLDAVATFINFSRRAGVAESKIALEFNSIWQ